ncbi:MAG: UPF0182 family protein [Cyanobacteria bacterium P01_A01_bin.116]
MNIPRSSRPVSSRPAPLRPNRWWWILGIGILLLTFSSTLIHWLTEYWWFESAGFASIFKLRLGWSLLCAVLAFAVYAAVLYGNYWLALRLTRDRPFYTPKNSEWAPFIPGMTVYGGIGLIILLALGAAGRGSQAWEGLLKFFNATAFGLTDPIYQQDIGFYIFKVPVYQGLQTQALELLIWSLILVGILYAIRGEIRLERGWKYFLTGPVKTHLCVILSAIALVSALGYWLARYDLLYSATGVVFGAGYTDVNARLHSYGIMGVVTLVVALLFIVSLWRRGFSLPITSIALYFTIFLVISGLYPWIQQSLVVEPNELDKERPFIAHNLEFTRQAYGLTDVQREDFVVEDSLDRAALENNSGTFDNLRLWDYETLLSTYQELQSLRLYYRFHDVDIDRYTIDDDYRQVMLSARELDYQSVDVKAQNWVNQRLKYTHGYGVAMSPVNQVTVEGLPDFFIKSIPPTTSTDITLDQPRIYYGEETNHHIFTGTSTDEFDYPLGNDNATNQYDGSGGVRMGSFGRRLAYAFDFGTLKPLVSNYFTRSSKIHYHRNIVRRAQQIVPFLQLDSDPYLALIDGRFKWILDGYTTSDRYPYSEPLLSSPDAGPLLESEEQLAKIALTGTNYIRDAAKVVIDAYDGSLVVYTMDETDPILSTYQKIFPELFTPLAEASDTLRSHFRYPLNLFQVQSQIYRAYHMENTEVFYNREDLWQVPQQLGTGGDLEQMQPYYVIMGLPNTEGEEFLQILPFTPSKKDNMVAWMAARCDGEQYGKLVLYKFPKQVLVYGPQQIEGRIDQNTDISQQLTLWDQQGSSVIRGNLLVIPVDQSLLYFEPVYLKAEQGALPELKRVIVAFKNTIVMRQTLPEALEAVFGAPAGSTASAAANAPEAAAKPPRVSGAQPTATDISGTANLVQAAIDAYEQGEKALQSGDWAAYGQSQRRLGELLQQLEGTSQSKPQAELQTKPQGESQSDSQAKPEPKPQTNP